MPRSLLARLLMALLLAARFPSRLVLRVVRVALLELWLAAVCLAMAALLSSLVAQAPLLAAALLLWALARVARAALCLLAAVLRLPAHPARFRWTLARASTLLVLWAS
jgi:hypothetical protein